MKSVVTVETRSVSAQRGKVHVARRHRKRGEDLLVFMHGFGCAKESFDGAFTAGALAEYSLLTFDFPEHGESGSLPERADIEGAAEVVTSLLSEFDRRHLYLVCHSMGGAIGVVAARKLPDLAGFISVEGNLVADDCGLVSRGVAQQSANDFKERGFSEFVQWLERSPERSHREWVKWYRRCDPRGLHGLAKSLVDWCDHRDLAGILGTLGPSAYVHGSHSDVAHLKEILGDSMYQVDGAGHFPMIDEPDAFYRLIGERLDSFATNGWMANA
ncbi:alpha/beta fold hydrolase [Paractinoplanes lichenicola]|uniref:Alpha/beta hydrolase n=1 Tax=Paractinoplanes lichenicola TaxID=2802976 RepID=A0ABS1VVL1_9ACTN|nr:alpha/beta hydrolase [Actinoplanes lichenicola]MBL7258518.1 alpha/beta hydrolase [Actinoplanes lichenicola]